MHVCQKGVLLGVWLCIPGKHGCALIWRGFSFEPGPYDVTSTFGKLKESVVLHSNSEGIESLSVIVLRTDLQTLVLMEPS